MENLITVIATGCGILVGGALGWAWALLRVGVSRREALHAAEIRVGVLEAEQGQLAARLEEAHAHLAARDSDLAAARREATALEASLARSRQQAEDAATSAEERIAGLQAARKEMADRFQALAQEALVRTGEQLSRQQQERLQVTLQPLAEHLTRFQTEVRTAYQNETRERASLREQITHLTELNRRLGAEADTLARALVGQSKTRGDWGEVILARILEHSGLREGDEYRLQASFAGGDGGRQQPDIIIDLPDGKSLVIDAKLTLVPWMELTAAADGEAQAAARQRLIAGVRGHLRGLSAKRYQDLHQIATVDFVLMFVPVEAAFVEVLGCDASLYEDALAANVVLVSPSTLMAVLRTVALTWRHERQEKNAERIARLAGKMVDQLAAYVEALDEVGSRLQQAGRAWEVARKRLVDGRGNVIRRAEQLRELGARVGKRLPQELRDEAAAAEGE